MVVAARLLNRLVNASAVSGEVMDMRSFTTDESNGGVHVPSGQLVSSSSSFPSRCE